jgi:uncharacterized membrane protein
MNPPAITVRDDIVCAHEDQHLSPTGRQDGSNFAECCRERCIRQAKKRGRLRGPLECWGIDASVLRGTCRKRGRKDLLVLLGCAAFCVGAVAGSRAARLIGPWRSTLWAIAVAGAAFFPIAATHIESFSSLTFDPVIWIALFHLSMCATILACVAWSFALERGGIARVAPLQFAQPVLALIFAAALLGERVSFASILCGVTILTGVVVAWRNASAAKPTNDSVWSRGTPSDAGLTASVARPRKRLFFLLATIAATTAAIAWARPVWADEKPVDLLLVLAADVSYSINDEEFRLQQAAMPPRSRARQPSQRLPRTPAGKSPFVMSNGLGMRPRKWWSTGR